MTGGGPIVIDDQSFVNEEQVRDRWLKGKWALSVNPALYAPSEHFLRIFLVKDDTIIPCPFRGNVATQTCFYDLKLDPCTGKWTYNGPTGDRKNKGAASDKTDLHFSTATQMKTQCELQYDRGNTKQYKFGVQLIRNNSLVQPIAQIYTQNFTLITHTDKRKRENDGQPAGKRIRTCSIECHFKEDLVQLYKDFESGNIKSLVAVLCQHSAFPRNYESLESNIRKFFNFGDSDTRIDEARLVTLLNCFGPLRKVAYNITCLSELFYEEEYNMSTSYYAGSHSDDFIESNFNLDLSPENRTVIVNSTEITKGDFKIYYKNSDNVVVKERIRRYINGDDSGYWLFGNLYNEMIEVIAELQRRELKPLSVTFVHKQVQYVAPVKAGAAGM